MSMRNSVDLGKIIWYGRPQIPYWLTKLIGPRQEFSVEIIN